MTKMRGPGLYDKGGGPGKSQGFQVRPVGSDSGAVEAGAPPSLPQPSHLSPLAARVHGQGRGVLDSAPPRRALQAKKSLFAFGHHCPPPPSRGDGLLVPAASSSLQHLFPNKVTIRGGLDVR